MTTKDVNDKSSSNSRIGGVGQRRETEALIKRLGSQFGNVNLDLEFLGTPQGGDENEEIVAALELEETETIEKSVPYNSNNHYHNAAFFVAPTDTARSDAGDITTEQQLLLQHKCDSVAEAEAAALMARLDTQFGDLDMSQLGLGFIGSGESRNANMKYDNTHFDGSGSSNYDNNSDSSDNESSLEDPTLEELAAWQASQFSRGRKRMQQREADGLQIKLRAGGNGTVGSIQQRRQILRETEKQRAGSSTVQGGPSSILDLLGGDTSTFFGPSTTGILEELVSEATDGDSEVLGVHSWKRLYASYEQGLGFWNLWKALKDYGGPTLLILRCQPSASKSLVSFQKQDSQGDGNGRTRTACLGFYTTTPWKESADLFGGDIGDIHDGDRAFLFSINEKENTRDIGQDEGHCRRCIRFFPVRQASGESTKDGGGYMYCLPPIARMERSSGKSKTRAVVGLGVGGSPTQPRFHLTDTLEDCSCLTYDSARATRDGDLFACFDLDDDDSNKYKDNSETISANTKTAIRSTDDTRSHPDKGHSFAQALYCFDVSHLEIWGIGGKEWINQALQERERSRRQQILRYQKIDKQMLWDQRNVRKSPAAKSP